jgi:phage shock protein C
MAKKLFRSMENRKIAGVCGGLGEYFDIDPTIIRLLWVAITLGFGGGIVAYILAWIIVPQESLVKVVEQPNSV